MTFHWPQIAMVLLAGTSLGLHGSKHGEPRDGHYNFYVQFLCLAIEFWILWCGGFFA